MAVCPKPGNSIVADTYSHHIRVVDVADDTVHTLAGSTVGFADVAGPAAKFHSPIHVACDSTGNVYVTDPCNHRVRRITVRDVCCTVSTLAGASHRATGTAWARRCGSAARGNRGEWRR